MARKKTKRECKGCGAEFVSDRSVFCSRSCANKHKWVDREYPEGVAATRVVGQPHVVAKHYRRHCRTRCQPRVATAYAAHLKAGRYAIRGSVRVCASCSKTWYRPYGAKGSRAFCSELCIERNKKKHKAIYKAKRRASVKDPTAHNIDPVEVFEQHCWRCYACHCYCPPELRGTTHPNAPELDHWKPLALGGKHRRHNVQLLCRTCNQLKGSKPWWEFLAS